MSRGNALSAQQIRDAIAYNRRCHAHHTSLLQRALGMAATGIAYDEGFIRAVADWQEDNLGSGRGDGKVGPMTEAHLNIQHPQATTAANRALATQRAGNVLFDSWYNDLRDNDDDGLVDQGRSESGGDGTHYQREYLSFRVVAGTYGGLGWGLNRTLRVPSDRTITGNFRYRVCADIVSGAYHEAGIIPGVLRSTRSIFDALSHRCYVFRKSQDYPSEYLPGDFICTLDSHGGHSGMVVARGPTRQVPQVVELPGPSTMVDLNQYDPTSTNDIRHQ
ncbi:MAG: hypothetical protein HC877_03710 [Thioploca sp.]|nr:hypothetical protein [Thioploca sp.]